MTTAAAPRPLTAADLLAFPEDGVDRWLICGELREKPMTVRNRFHSRIMVRFARFLDQWLDTQPEPRGSVLCGEAGVVLQRDPETVVGVDVAYIPPEVATQQTDATTLIDGVPTLVVEVLSPSDTVDEIDEKIETYLAAGVAHIWIVNPRFRTILVHRPDQRPELFDETQDITAEPEMPGLRVRVGEMFV